MKKLMLFIGILFSMLMTMPSNAQKIGKEKQGDTTRTGRLVKIKSPKMEVVTPRQMEQTKRYPKTRIVKKREVFGPVDPLTGEISRPYPTESTSEEFTVNAPPTSFQYPNSNWFFLNNSVIWLEGEATQGHTLETKMFRAHNGEYTLVQNWTPTNDEQNGIWSARIPWNGVADGQSVILKILIRDIANRSDVKTIFMGRD